VSDEDFGARVIDTGSHGHYMSENVRVAFSNSMQSALSDYHIYPTRKDLRESRKALDINNQ
jgi:hypothetical protein